MMLGRYFRMPRSASAPALPGTLTTSTRSGARSARERTPSLPQGLGSDGWSQGGVRALFTGAPSPASVSSEAGGSPGALVRGRGFTALQLRSASTGVGAPASEQAATSIPVTSEAPAREIEPRVVECSGHGRYVHIAHAGADGREVVTPVPARNLKWSGNPLYAPADLVRAALTESPIAHLPAAQQQFIELRNGAALREKGPAFLDALNASFASPAVEEKHVFYSGCHHLSSAQSALVDVPAMFLTTCLGEAHGYSNQDSVVLKFCARSTAHQTIDETYGASEYRTAADAKADGVRVIGVIPGRGKPERRSALSGNNYD